MSSTSTSSDTSTTSTRSTGSAAPPAAPPGGPPVAVGPVARAHPRVALAVIVTCQLMLILDATVMNVALPRIQAALGFSAAGLAWVMSSYTLTFGGLLLLGGRAGDVLGRRRLFIGGIALFTVASLLGGLAPAAGWLIAARVLQGVGAAAAGPNTVALILSTFTEQRARVRALALLSAVSGGGFAIGLIVGGVLTELASWRWVLFINVPFGIAAAVLAARFVVEPPRHPGRPDVVGAVLATSSVALLVWSFLRAATDGWAPVSTWGLLVAGLVLLAGFVAVEARTAQPLLPLRLFADRDRAAGYLNFLLGPAAMMSMFFFLTQFLQVVRGFGALATGFAFLPTATGMFAMTRVVPRLLPRFGPRPLVVTGALSMVAGMAGLTQLTPGSGYVGGVLGPMILLGIGGGLGFTPLMPVIMARVEPRDAGVAAGTLQTMQQVGGSLGLAVLVTVYGSAARDAARAHRAQADVLVHGMTAAFTVAALIATVAVVVGLTFRRPVVTG